MPVRKKYVVERTSTAIAAAVSQAEIFIDKKLETYLKGYPIQINTKDIPVPTTDDENFRPEVIKQLIDIYKKNGWKVSHQAQKEGDDFLIFN